MWSLLNGLYLQKKQMKHDVYSLESMLLCAINNYIAELFVSFFSLWGGSHRRSWWPSCRHFCPLYLKPLETRVQTFARYLLYLYLVHEFSFSWVYVFVGNQVGVNFSCLEVHNILMLLFCSFFFRFFCLCNWLWALLWCMLVDGADCGFLFSGYLYYAGESIFAVLGEA